MNGNPQQASATEREKNKTDRQKAEDIAYTINHALVCFATDVIDPFVAAWSQKHLGTTLHTSFCNKTHDHGHQEHPTSNHHQDHHHHAHCNHGHHHAEHHQPPSTKPQSPKHHDDHNHHEDITFGGALKHWFVGEALGDLGAVPVTIAFQRFTPGFMEWLGQGMETALGPLYKRGAMQAAKDWARQNGMSPDAPEVKIHGDELYRHEVAHFGQVAVWTCASVGLNIASQKYVTGNHLPVSCMLLYKTLGAATTAALLVGGRSFFPEKFHAWDGWTSENIFKPATTTVSKLFGVDEKSVAQAAKKTEYHNVKWEDRIAANTSSPESEPRR